MVSARANDSPRGTGDFNDIDLSANFSVEDFLRVAIEYGKNNHWFDTKTEVLLVTAYCTVILLGLCTNGVVCLAAVRRKSLRDTKNWFIVNLAVSDIMICGVGMPFTLVRLILKNWHLGDFLCRLMPALQTLHILVSTLTILAIAVDRYHVIVYSSSRSPRYSVAHRALPCVWVLSGVFSVPVLIFHRVEGESIMNGILSYTVCVEKWPSFTWRTIYTGVTMIIQYLIPMGTIIVLHTLICRFLRLRIAENPGRRSGHLSHLKRHRRNIRLLTLIAVSFGGLWLPLTVVNLVADSHYSIFLQKNFNLVCAICLLIAMSSTCINPIIYGWFHSNFRNEILALVLCRTVTEKEADHAMSEKVTSLCDKQESSTRL